MRAQTCPATGIRDLTHRPYAIDAGRHAPSSLLVTWLRQDGRFEEWPVDEPPDPLSPLLARVSQLVE